jgi:hypothetical protein
MNNYLSNSSMIPPINELKRKLQSLAMLDAILMSDWPSRYFSFNSKWGPDEMMGSMRDGEGGEFFFLFGPFGAAGKIYSKEMALGPNAVSALASVPADFSSFLSEPAFSINLATCYLWRRPRESAWSVAPVGIEKLPFLAFIGDQGEHYRAWASDYYETALSMDAVRAIFRQHLLTPALMKSINPNADTAAAVADAEEIGYPH